MASRIRGIGGTDAGNVRTPRLNVEDLKDIRAVMPDVPEQEEIADFLDGECARIGTVLEEIDGQRSAIDELGTVAFGAMAAGKPEAALRRFVRSVTDGPFGSSLASEHYVESEETRVIRLGNVGSARFLDEDRAFIADSYAHEALGEHFVAEGDLIIAGLGDANRPLGRACVVPDHVLPAINKADCYRVQIDSGKCLAQYLALALTYGPARQAAALLSRGATRARLNSTVARDLPVPIASLGEQRGIIHGCDQAMSRGLSAERELSELAEGLREYRDALITEVVTGQLDFTRLSTPRMDESLDAVRQGEHPDVLAT
jgi:type I restriction enzyme S subunit